MTNDPTPSTCPLCVLSDFGYEFYDAENLDVQIGDLLWNTVAMHPSRRS